MDPREDRLSGVLLGTALGDALGLPYEGLSPANLRRRAGKVIDRYALLPGIGFVSDDTEQAALLAQSIIRARTGDGHLQPELCLRHFRRALLGWFLRLPFGVGLATVRACLNIILGRRHSGVRSAGNGAAMRAPLVGVFFADDPARRRDFGRALAEVTHTDPRAVDAALFAAELAALAAQAARPADRSALARQALTVVTEPTLAAALRQVIDRASTPGAAFALGNSGFVLHTMPLALDCFLRHGDRPLAAISTAILAGGDTDTSAAIVGAWVGALGGALALPGRLIASLCPGPFGEQHLRQLARALAYSGSPAPRYSALAAMARNLLLYPVILAHALRRLIPA